MDQPSKPTPEIASSEINLGHTFSAALAVLLAGLAVLWWATHGGQGFTTEALRRQQIEQHPQLIAPFALTTSGGKNTQLSTQRSTQRNTHLSTLLAADKKVWLVDFVYTRCQTVCSALGSVYQQLQAQIEARGLEKTVGLLSISFDPANDDASRLADYAARMQMNPAVWQIATLSDWQDRRRLLDEFGIMVIPAPLGEFEHNAALHLVNSQGVLVKIMDYLDYATALDVAVAVSQGQPSALAVSLKHPVKQPAAP